jgi:hypothetical protein
MAQESGLYMPLCQVEKHAKVHSSIFPRLGGSRTKRTSLIGRMGFRVLFCSPQDVQSIRALNGYVNRVQPCTPTDYNCIKN